MDRRLRLLAWLARRFGYHVTVSGLGVTMSRPMNGDDFLRALAELDKRYRR